MNEQKTKSDKGIVHQIRENDGPVPDDFDHSKLMDAIEEMMKPSPVPELRRMWLFGNGLKKFHESLGDKQFKKLVESGRIVTDGEGMDYINSLGL